MAITASQPTSITVELFGVPQVLTGRRVVAVDGATLAEVAAALAAGFPELRGTVIDAERGWLLGGYTFVVDDTFTRDPSCPVGAGRPVLLVSSAAGG